MIEMLLEAMTGAFWAALGIVLIFSTHKKREKSPALPIIGKVLGAILILMGSLKIIQALAQKF